jgi:hypothetical protein
MTWTNESSTADDSFHPRSDDPWWNESSFITFRVPGRSLLGIIYFYFRPNQNTAMGGPIIVDPSGDEFSTCLHTGWAWHMPIPDCADMYDFKLANGLSSRTVATQQCYQISYESAGCSFDLRFVADTPPFAMQSNGKKSNQGLADFVGSASGAVTAGHFDQTGCISGWLQLEDKRIEVRDSAAFRDRSWGPRPLVQAQEKGRGSLAFARASSRSMFIAWTTSASAWRDDAIIGSVDRIASGIYARDGVASPFVSGTRRVIERRSNGVVVSESIEAVDALGRTLKAQGRLKSVLRWPGTYGDLMSFWGYEEWTFDGHTQAPGELQEWMMCRHFRKVFASESGQ